MLHAFDKMDIDHNQVVISQGKARLRTWLQSDRGMSISQIDQFDTPFNTGVPEGYHKDKPNQWHLTCQTSQKSKTARISALMAVDSQNDEIRVEIKEERGWIGVQAVGTFGRSEGWLQFQPGSEAPRKYVKNQKIGEAKICAEDNSGKILVF
jgi:hypothetical protein